MELESRLSGKTVHLALFVYLCIASVSSAYASLVASQTETLIFGSSTSAQFDKLNPALATGSISVVLNWSWSMSNGGPHFWFLESLPNGVKDDSLSYGPLFTSGGNWLANSDLYATDALEYIGEDAFLIQWVVFPDSGSNFLNYPDWSESMTLTLNYYDNSVSAVPVPAAAWLFGTALAGLGFARRYKQRTLAA